MPMFAGKAMTTEQAEKLNLIIRRAAGAAKRSIDEFAEIAESALTVFVENDEPNRKELPPMVSENRLLKIEELADRLQISVRKISDLQTEGLPTVKLGKSVRFDYEEVLIYLKDRRNGSRRKNNLRVVR